MSFKIEPELERHLDEVLARYPQKRSAALMFLHALQERHGFISAEAMEWTAGKLGVAPISIIELVTFYPMFRQAPAGKFVFKVCRTLSCALGGSHELYHHLCQKFGLDPHAHGLQTTPDGKFSVEFVECLASCGTAPVMMVNDEFYDGVTAEKVDRLVAECGVGK
jgi:NADH-quinone oxidoreductase subunit E